MAASTSPQTQTIAEKLSCFSRQESDAVRLRTGEYRPTDPPLSVPRVLASRRVAVRRRSQRASAPHLLPPRTQTTAIEGVVGATRLLGVESCTDMQVEPGVHDTAPPRPPLLGLFCRCCRGGCSVSPFLSPPFLKILFLHFVFVSEVRAFYIVHARGDVKSAAGCLPPHRPPAPPTSRQLPNPRHFTLL